MVDVGWKLGSQARSALFHGFQSQGLHCQSFAGFCFVAQGFVDELVHGFDTLDQELALVGRATGYLHRIHVLYTMATTTIKFSS